MYWSKKYYSLRLMFFVIIFVIEYLYTYPISNEKCGTISLFLNKSSKVKFVNIKLLDPFLVYGCQDIYCADSRMCNGKSRLQVPISQKLKLARLTKLWLCVVDQLVNSKFMYSRYTCLHISFHKTWVKLYINS